MTLIHFSCKCKWNLRCVMDDRETGHYSRARALLGCCWSTNFFFVRTELCLLSLLLLLLLECTWESVAFAPNGGRLVQSPWWFFALRNHRWCNTLLWRSPQILHGPPRHIITMCVVLRRFMHHCRRCSSQLHDLAVTFPWSVGIHVECGLDYTMDMANSVDWTPVRIWPTWWHGSLILFIVTLFLWWRCRCSTFRCTIFGLWCCCHIVTLWRGHLRNGELFGFWFIRTLIHQEIDKKNSNPM